MTELQWSLIVIGILSVGGVWAYNLWQERRHRKQAQDVFRSQQKDVLMREAAVPAPQPAVTPAAPALAQQPEAFVAAAPTDAPVATVAVPERNERIEPVFILPADVPDVLDAPEASGEAMVTQGQDTPAAMRDTAVTRIEPGIEPVTDALSAPSAESPAVFTPDPESPLEIVAGVVSRDEPGLTAGETIEIIDEELPVLDTVVDREPPLALADPVTDCIVHLNAPELVSAPLFWAAQRQILNRLANRIVWSGLDENTARWQRLQANDANSYRRLVGALQLADRHGPVAADDLALYCDGVRQLATQYQAQAIVPVVADVLVRARSLDEFCAAVDWRLSLNLVQREGKGLSLEAIMQLAEMAGMRRFDRQQSAGNDLLHAVDARGRTVFTLGLPAQAGVEDMTHVGGLSLTLDVPLVTDGVAAFDRMTQLAHHMVGRLEAVIVDEQRKPLADDVLGRIRSKIGELQQQMTTHQIPPGEPRAMRLYA
jgi:hypothetical protein